MTIAKLATVSEVSAKRDEFLKQANSIILDKAQEIRLTFCCLVANGHMMIEDVPGVGKTTLVKTFSHLLNLKSTRIQFTNDMLPADIIGSSIFDSEKKKFTFHPGPIFSQLVLADELNRATPKTQSACLQAMEERKISIDGNTYELDDPFFLIATQNPRSQIGTFPLPESQLDRFLMRIELGYPSRDAERMLLLGQDRSLMLEKLEPVLSPRDLVIMQDHARHIFVSEAIVKYIQDIIARTRQTNRYGQGLSPRGALCLVRASQAWAYLMNREMVLPEDVQAVAVSVMSHRLNPVEDLSGESGKTWAKEILSSVRVE